jgi:ketosteroid isomerase-like protein
LRHLAVLELLRGRPDKARAMLADAREVVADLGLRHGLMETELFAGIIESMEGDPVAAEPHFRTALEGLDALGAGADAGLAAALLARSVLAQGRLDEADRYAEESERLAGRNLKTAIAWRSARAEILSAQGCYDESVTMARDAVAVAAGTDLVLDHALACLALSRVLAAAGNTLGAGSARDDADRLYAAKEVTSTVGRSVERAGNAVASAAPSAASTTSSRLAVTNESVRRTPDYFAAMRAHDVEGTLRFYADEFVYDDHRRISGELLRGRESMRAAIEGVVKQYSRFESRVMAVRGQRLGLVRTCFADDAGNESTTFDVGQIDEAGLITYLGRFDEDDFEGAYRELERRYFAGEGKAFAEPGAVAMDWVIAMNRGDVDRAFVELAAPSGHTENRSRMPFPDPSISDPATSYRDLETMVVSTRTWPSAGCWLRNGWFVVRIEREAVGLDGETYAWSWLNVSAVRDGRFVASCIFDVEDEDAAFGYAEERMRATDSRLALTNRVTRPWQLFWAAMRAHDADGALECSSDAFLYDDRRNINGDPIRDRGGLRAGLARILEQYTDFETRVLAVRGENLLLGQSRWLNDAGFETTHLHVVESGDDGRFAHEVRFDEDFESAYGELERRYYVGEGAPFADAGAVVSDSMTALNEGDVDRLFGELYTPDVHIENRSRTFYADRSIAEIRGSTNELAAMVALSRTWQSAVQWISPTWCVCRPEREAIGHDGEKYSWTWLFALEVCKGHVATMCVFEQEDEDAAFAYAEERAHASTSRLAVTNRASATSEAGWRAMQAGDVDALVAVYDDRFVYDDQRRLSGDPIENIAALRSAGEQMLEHFARVEWRTLAVRGERLHLARTRWSNDAGYETAYLHIAETDGDGRITYSSYFDEDDFEGAYVGLERRYYAGEGAPFAESGLVVTDYIIAYNQGDFDRFGELTASDLWIKNRSRSGFPDLSAAGWRTSLEGLAAMVTSSRAWISAMRWVSPTVSVSRTERESVGLDGEPFAWCCLVVSEIRDGRLVSMCQFELDDEEAAFAYAEERVRKSVSRLVATNRASQAGETRRAAMEDTDVDGAVACCSDGFVQDDRRRLSGDPIRGLGELRLSCERALAQYCRFEVRTLAVRGERLQLFWGRWSNEAGYESTHLGINEVDDDGRISYQVRFDEDDFEGAYRELDERYYAGEGAAYAEAGLVVTETVIALNQGDLDRVFRELIHPDQRFEIHSRSAFPDRSATDLRASLGELTGWVASMRTWHPAMCWLSPTRCVFRSERVAVGRDGENYAWTQLYAIEVREGRAVASCEFEVDDEEAAFAYAEDRIRAENPSVGQVDP